MDKRKHGRYRFFRPAIGAMLVFLALAYARPASAEYPVPLEGRDFFMKKGPKSTSLYVEIGMRWMWSPNFALVISKKIGKPVTTYDIRRDNPEKTIALCQKPGDGFYLGTSKNHTSRSSDAVWSDCPEDKRYVYLLPKIVLEITGFKHVTIETKLEVAEALEKCADAACVQEGLNKLGNQLKLSSVSSAASASPEPVTPSASDTTPKTTSITPASVPSANVAVDSEAAGKEGQDASQPIPAAAVQTPAQKGVDFSDYRLWLFGALTMAIGLVVGRRRKKPAKSEAKIATESGSKTATKGTEDGFDPTKTLVQTLLKEENRQDSKKASKQKAILLKQLLRLGVKSVDEKSSFLALVAALSDLSAVSKNTEKLAREAGDLRDHLIRHGAKSDESLESMWLSATAQHKDETAQKVVVIKAQLVREKEEAVELVRSANPDQSAKISELETQIHEIEAEKNDALSGLHVLLHGLSDDPGNPALSSDKPAELVEAISGLIGRHVAAKDAEIEKIRTPLVEAARRPYISVGLQDTDGEPVSTVALAFLVLNKYEEIAGQVVPDLLSWLDDLYPEADEPPPQISSDQPRAIIEALRSRVSGKLEALEAEIDAVIENGAVECRDLYDQLNVLNLRMREIEARFQELDPESATDNQELADLLKEQSDIRADAELLLDRFEGVHERVAGFRVFDTDLLRTAMERLTRDLEKSHQSRIAVLEGHIEDLESRLQLSEEEQQVALRATNKSPRPTYAWGSNSQQTVQIEPTMSGALDVLNQLLCNGSSLTLKDWPTLRDWLVLQSTPVNIEPDALRNTELDRDTVDSALGKVTNLSRLQGCRLETLRETIGAIIGSKETLPKFRGGTLRPPAFVHMTGLSPR
ncbi:MAG: hypothetical protein ABIB04_03760 [Patescibacteria group bacterium]